MIMIRQKLGMIFSKKKNRFVPMEKHVSASGMPPTFGFYQSMFKFDIYEKTIRYIYNHGCVKFTATVRGNQHPRAYWQCRFIYY